MSWNVIKASALRPVGVGMVAMLMVAGCASKATPPVAELATAQSAVIQAESAGAREHAAQELLMAREKLAQAESAMQAERYEQALQLAEQAIVDARLAEAKVRTVRAQRAVDEVKEGIETLRGELERRPNR